MEINDKIYKKETMTYWVGLICGDCKNQQTINTKIGKDDFKKFDPATIQCLKCGKPSILVQDKEQPGEEEVIIPPFVSGSNKVITPGFSDERIPKLHDAIYKVAYEVSRELDIPMAYVVGILENVKHEFQHEFLVIEPDMIDF